VVRLGQQSVTYAKCDGYTLLPQQDVPIDLLSLFELI
jgi:hypothetical protein